MSLSPDQIASLPALIKIEAVCTIAGVSKATARRLITIGKLPAPFHGQFFRKADVLAALGMGPAPAAPTDAPPVSPWASGLDHVDDSGTPQRPRFSIGEWSHANRRPFVPRPNRRDFDTEEAFNQALAKAHKRQDEVNAEWAARRKSKTKRAHVVTQRVES